MPSHNLSLFWQVLYSLLFLDPDFWPDFGFFWPWSWISPETQCWFCSLWFSCHPHSWLSLAPISDFSWNLAPVLCPQWPALTSSAYISDCISWISPLSSGNVCPHPANLLVAPKGLPTGLAIYIPDEPSQDACYGKKCCVKVTWGNDKAPLYLLSINTEFQKNHVSETKVKVTHWLL